MTFNYSRAAQTAVRLLTSFGQDGVVRRLVPGNGPSYKPGPPVDDDYPVKMAVTKYSLKDIDGTRVLATDLKVLVAPNIEIEPTTADLLVLADGSRLAIVSVTPLKPAGTVLLWTVQARRA